MVRNEEIYKQALIFRKQGFSYSEIANVCGVSKSTVSNWFAKQKFSKEVSKRNAERAARDNKQRIKLLNTARQRERAKMYKEAVRQADTEYRHYKSSPLFIAGLMLYVAQGDQKNTQQIRLSTGQMDTHRIFQKFAREYLGVPREKVHFWLLYPAQTKESQCIAAWNKKLKLTKVQWYKNQTFKNTSSNDMLRFGVGNTIIGSTVLKQKLSRWIELATKQL